MKTFEHEQQNLIQVFHVDEYLKKNKNNRIEHTTEKSNNGQKKNINRIAEIDIGILNINKKNVVLYLNCTYIDQIFEHFLYV